MSAGNGPLLAIDSSTRAAYVALWAGGRTVAEQTVAAASNASSALLPAVDAALRDAGLAPADLGGLVVGGGPGSFTGLRIAAATAKGMVHALRVPLFAYSGLMAAAAAQGVFGLPVCALFDARNREVFAGAWRFGEDGGVEEVLPITALRVDDLRERLGGEVHFCGEGAVQYADDLRAAFGPGAVLGDDASLAAGLLWLARNAPDGGRVADAAAWEPEYVRAAGVERIAAARAG
ncbi:MAG TPA: tRNA (adenosine(37)-N6)-threonylcarbamoyltransferase complex dimerization subunit type 1 TsaB [Longimicrobium sp.]|jgi:tRNA threonylcarbamoyladenosine biosynthesis protein TsaB|uniref:tRNA (adenosine(37)-N6)-threonylcarbamoyltransferase complex dimerization subunit type 1 TsaB n=1 Tax=Longimicrobium sp. TaxID=2029185 RepID=UPI002ED888F5